MFICKVTLNLTVLDVENYRQTLARVAKRHAQFQPANGNIQTHAVCDRETDEFMAVDSGWNEKGRRIYDVVPHFRLRGRHRPR